MRNAVAVLSSAVCATTLIWCAGSVNATGSRSSAVITQVPLFPETMTKEQWAGAHAAGWFNLPGIDFGAQATVWTGAGLQGASGNAAPASLTYSFPADGTSWTLGATNAPNALNAAITAAFTAANADQGREFIRQAMGAWKRYGGLTFTEVADDNVAYTTAVAPVATRGDIRIGGVPAGAGAPLAASNIPAQGGDIAFNTSLFNAGNTANPANSFRSLRNVSGHELGTALGLTNVVPCNNTKLMEGQLNTGFDGPQIDDIRGIGRLYGDRYAGNQIVGGSRNYGNIVNPAPQKSIRERDLTLNGLTGPNDTDEDWFRFQTTIQFVPMTITATPTGGSYLNGVQGATPCSGSTATVNANAAGRLRVEIFNSAGMPIDPAPAFTTSVLATQGSAAVLTIPSLPPGNYSVRVSDAGPNAAADQVVQSYNLEFLNGNLNAFSAPYANAGVSKRVAVGQTCFFMGDINSHATQPSATISTYDWDLDGNGSFEVTNNPRPTRVYNVDGQTIVTLRVTDSNGRTATDSITVTAFGGVTAAAWRAVPNTISPRTNTAPGTDPIAGAAWTSGGPWNTFDLVVEGREGAQIQGVNAGGDGSSAVNHINASGPVFNHAAGADVRSFNLETTFAALFFDTYACYGGTTTTDGGLTNFAGPTNGLNPNSGRIVFTSFTQPAASLAADVAAPFGGSIRVLRVSIRAGTDATVGGGDSRVEIGLPNNAIIVLNVPLAQAALPPCQGDTDGDRDVDFTDLNRILTAFGSTTGQPNFIAGCDLDGDGDVDFADLNTCLTFFGTSCPSADAPIAGRGEIIEIRYPGLNDGEAMPGDVDRDGRISFTDLNMVLNLMGAAANPGVPADLNADGVVDEADLNEVLARFGSGN